MRAYPATNHNLIKALERAEVLFPISLPDLTKRMDGVKIRVGWEQVVPFNEYIAKIQIEHFETKGQFFAALAASRADLASIVV